jgi:hypothetical protein
MHYCPDCGAPCYCGGDLDDTCTGEDIDCSHECEEDSDWPEDDDTLQGDDYP